MNHAQGCLYINALSGYAASGGSGFRIALRAHMNHAQGCDTRRLLSTGPSSSPFDTVGPFETGPRVYHTLGFDFIYSKQLSRSNVQLSDQTLQPAFYYN